MKSMVLHVNLFTLTDVWLKFVITDSYFLFRINIQGKNKNESEIFLLGNYDSLRKHLFIALQFRCFRNENKIDEVCDVNRL